MPELLTVKSKRVAVNRSTRVRLTPSLLDFGEVEAFQPNRSLRGVATGKRSRIKFRGPSTRKKASGQQGHSEETTGEAG
jgi:hypothetical protein